MLARLVPQYPVFRPEESWSDRNFNDGNANSQEWSNDYDNYHRHEDLPPMLMSMDFTSFDPSQLRQVPVSLLSSNGQLTELDANTRMKNYQDYKQRCQLLERLSWEYNENNYSDDYHHYDNYNSNNR